ncbi:hypothetical protein TUBRATIS_19240 [Tubulinosema ratisbonensis]|uniref:Uncharacterized protein n=1 Tax=Tubulinosema ratisbonensis TaxID=291195 RepID=A0A437AKJ0_9MICR|nr:hypothetical protein TUBRATIS_19240 [Tubulinosema ratisbonensis]
MNKKYHLPLIYILSLFLIIIDSFYKEILSYFINKYNYSHLSKTFNQKIQEINLEGKEYEFWKIIRKLIIFHDYFKHKLLLQLIKEGYSLKNFRMALELWNNLEIKPKKYILYYSDMYNLGIFLPFFFPVLIHFYKKISKK